ncbi:MAG: hypothetical protein BroJett030_10300 [Alphaproteobacteria bacterium]|nr:MAG: hypothetical protein BroJett030_10300 [Alphaproteobacteria bacterium]
MHLPNAEKTIGEPMSKVIKNGTIVTADRTWKAVVLFREAAETTGIVG